MGCSRPAMTITPEQFEAHRRWIDGQPGGQRLNLADANLAHTYLAGANLTRAYLTGAYLCGADLTEANLYGADLTEADLTGAYLYGANLTRAYLTGAYLCGADLARTCVELLLDDDGRGYQVVAHHGLLSDGEPVYLAGCRKLTYHSAVAHWSNPDHQAPDSARAILAAIEAHHNSVGVQTSD